MNQFSLQEIMGHAVYFVRIDDFDEALLKLKFLHLEI